MGQLGFFGDMNRCTGCKSCVIACKDKNNLDAGINFRKVHSYEGGSSSSVWTASLSMACNHCAEPACLKVCPVVAIAKDADTGLVIQDRRMCILCERCVRACPYGEPAYVPGMMLVSKCDGCYALVAQAEKPACVAACSTRCLRFGELEELRQQFGPESLTSDLPVLPDSSRTSPSILIKPRRDIFTLPRVDGSEETGGSEL